MSSVTVDFMWFFRCSLPQVSKRSSSLDAGLGGRGPRVDGRDALPYSRGMGDGRAHQLCHIDR
jgi:hypothetical protein